MATTTVYRSLIAVNVDKTPAPLDGKSVEEGKPDESCECGGSPSLTRNKH